MRFILDKKYRKLIILISLPVLLIGQYYLFKLGILHPMVKGIEINISDGNYIPNIDEFVMEVNDELTLSSGEYIWIPKYAKEPDVKFQVLDGRENLTIEEYNKLVALKEGTSIIGVMKDSRVLKKINIKVVDPKVDLKSVNTSNELVYVGDKSTINPIIEVDYEKFYNVEDIIYESSNEEVIKVNKNKIEAVGVGKADVYVKAKDEIKILEYNIKARVNKIDIANTIELKVGETKNLNPKIQTNPEGLKFPIIKYELIERKLPVERAIRLDKDGTVVGLKEGQEKVKIICDNKYKVVTIKVVNNKDENEENKFKIENIQAFYEVVNEKLQISLMWDYIKDILQYDIYIKNISLSEDKFRLYESIEIKNEELLDNRVKTTIEIDLIDGKIPEVNLYVVGKNKTITTLPSDVIVIKPKEEEQEDIQDLAVENLVVSLNEETNTARLSWENINLQGVQYSVYIKNNLMQDEGFILLDSQINTNEYTINVEEVVDMDIYIQANIGDKYSNKSNIVNIKRSIDEESQ